MKVQYCLIESLLLSLALRVSSRLRLDDSFKTIVDRVFLGWYGWFRVMSYLKRLMTSTWSTPVDTSKKKENKKESLCRVGWQVGLIFISKFTSHLNKVCYDLIELLFTQGYYFIRFDSLYRNIPNNYWEDFLLYKHAFSRLFSVLRSPFSVLRSPFSVFSAITTLTSSLATTPHLQHTNFCSYSTQNIVITILPIVWDSQRANPHNHFNFLPCYHTTSTTH